MDNVTEHSSHTWDQNFAEKINKKIDDSESHLKETKLLAALGASSYFAAEDLKAPLEGR